VIIGGLNPAKTYTLKLMASRSSSVSPTGSDAMTTISNVTPDANGRINIGVFSPSNTVTKGAFSYLNELILQEN